MAVAAGGQPVDRREAEANEVVIDDAEIVAIEVAPDDRDEGGGDDHWQKIGEAEEIEQDRRHLAVEGEREQHADADVSGDREQREAQRVPEDLKRSVVREETDVIVEPDPARACHRVEVGEAQDEGDEDGSEDEDEIEKQRGQNEQVAGPSFGLPQLRRVAQDRGMHARSPEMGHCVEPPGASSGSMGCYLACRAAARLKDSFSSRSARFTPSSIEISSAIIATKLRMKIFSTSWKLTGEGTGIV